MSLASKNFSKPLEFLICQLIFFSPNENLANEEFSGLKMKIRNFTLVSTSQVDQFSTTRDVIIW